MKTTDRDVGRAVVARRQALGLTQFELSDKLKAAGLPWSQGTLSKVESGERPVRAIEIPILAGVLSTTWTALLNPQPPLQASIARAAQDADTAQTILDGATKDLARSRALITALLDLTSGKTTDPYPLIVGLDQHTLLAILEQVTGYTAAHVEQTTGLPWQIDPSQLLPGDDDDAMAELSDRIAALLTKSFTRGTP